MTEHISFQYFIDIANSAIFSTPISFTSKYPTISHYQEILEDQTRFEKILADIIVCEGEGIDSDTIDTVIAKNGFNGASADQVKQVLKTKYNEYKKEFIKKEMHQGGKHLAGFNWKLKNIIGCNQFTHKNKLILVLDLCLKEGRSNTEIHDVSLELSIPELRELITKLKSIQREMKS